MYTLSTAGLGGDYLSFSTTLTFPAGSGVGSSQCTLVQILDDDLVEDDENFMITATLVTPNPDITVGQDSGTVTITDIDSEEKAHCINTVLHLYIMTKSFSYSGHNWACPTTQCWHSNIQRS